MVTLRLLAVCALLLAGCAAAPPPAPDAPAAETKDQIIYVVRRGWHTDIGFPVSELSGADGGDLAAVAAEFPAARSILFGFGDRHYLQAREHGMGDVTALWPGAGLMLVTGLPGAPQQAFAEDQVVAWAVTRRQAAAAMAYVSRSILRDGQGRRRREGEGPYAGSLFYATNLRYSAWHTCNTWSAETLRAAGAPVGSRGVVFAWQLWPQALSLRPRLP